MPRCSRCEAVFDRDRLEEVGDALFCPACLLRLLRRARGADVAEAAPGPAAAPPVADPPCFVCGEPLEGRSFVQLRGFAICARCAPGLVASDRGTADGEAATAADAGETPGGPAPAVTDAALPVATPGARAERCASCGRPLPGPGSYHLVEGKPHCADCVAARTERRHALESGAIAAPALELCEACRRPATELRETRGFRLCVACVESAPDLALALAQARHRRLLERKGQRMMSEGEDD